MLIKKIKLETNPKKPAKKILKNKKLHKSYKFLKKFQKEIPTFAVNIFWIVNLTERRGIFMKFAILLFLILNNFSVLYATMNNIYFTPETLHESKSIFLLIDPESGYIIDSSNGANIYYGYKNLIGMNISQINTLAPFEVKLEMQKAKNEKRNYFHFKHRLANSEIKDVYVTSYPMLKNNSTVLFSSIKDVTADLRKEFVIQLFKYCIIIILFFACLIAFFLLKKIKENEKRYSDLFENMTEAFASYEMFYDKNTRSTNYRCTIVNPYFEELTNIKANTIIGKTITEILPNLELHIIEIFDKVAKTGEPISFKHYIKDRNKFYHYCAFSPSKNKFAVLFTDITDQENLKNQLKLEKERAEESATHDYLTKLPNRALLKDRIENSISLATRNKTNIAICMIDMDGFKQINDNYGHLVGDIVLKEVASRTKQSIRDFDTLSRFGGDEFICVLTNFSDSEYCQSIIERILTVNQQPIKIDNIEINPFFSIGISIFPHDGLTYNELIKNADNALYEAKNHGKNRYCFYNKFCVNFNETK